MQVAGDPAPSSAASSDTALVERANRGDHQAYAELVRRYSAIAHRTASLIVGPADAEDAVQEAFVRAFYALGRFRQGSPFKPWLLAIVVNAARNKARSSGQQPRLRERLSGDRAVGPLHIVASAESTALRADERRSLVEAIDASPADTCSNCPRPRLLRCSAGRSAQ